ncbi:MAG: hypothetical protein ACRCUM_03995 [Mycoplasmoidaceae bacterium]
MEKVLNDLVKSIKDKINNLNNEISFEDDVDYLISEFNRNCDDIPKELEYDEDLDDELNEIRFEKEKIWLKELWNETYNKINELEKEYKCNFYYDNLKTIVDSNGYDYIKDFCNCKNEKSYLIKCLKLIELINEENDIKEFSFSSISNSIYLTFKNEFEIRISDHDRKAIYNGLCFDDNIDNDLTIRLDKLSVEDGFQRFKELKEFHYKHQVKGQK